MVKDKKKDFVPPRDMWAVNADLDFNEPLCEDDPRYVDTEKGRGEFNFKRLLATLGVDVNSGELLREIIYKRADKDLFESEAIVDLLIENSGGNPRDLLKLLLYALQESDMERFTKPNMEKAIHNLANDYRKFLNTDDYKILYEIDHSKSVKKNSEQIRRLLYNLAILQYNNYWWSSHPVIRHLEGYPTDPRVVVV